MRIPHINLDGASGGMPNSVAALIANGADLSALRTHALLQKDEWKKLDDTVVRIARKRLRVVGDLLGRGLRYDLADALGTMIFEYETESDMNPAVINMTGKARGGNDTVNYELTGLPIPITSKFWELNARRLRASRKRGESLDTTQAAVAARKVAEALEQLTMVGSYTDDEKGAAQTIAYGTYTVYGLENHTSVNTGSLVGAWDDDSARDPKTDVLAMVQACVDVQMYGPFGIYVPREYSTALGDDYVNTTSTTITVQERLQKIPGVEFIQVQDYATATKITLFQLDEQTVRIVHGQDPTPVEWKSGDAMTLYHKVMAIMVPQVRADQDGNCGIAVYSE